MAKSRYRRKSSKRSKAAKKGWRTRRRHGHVAHYSRRSRRRGGSVSAKRRAAGRKAWRTKVRRYGHARAVAMIGRKKRHARRGRRRGRR